MPKRTREMIRPIAVLTMPVLAAALAGPADRTYINEFPHPRLVVHFHPTTQQFKLGDLSYALDHRVHAAELDLHLRARDGQVVCNHNAATDESPTLTSAMELILRKKGSSSTVNHDGLQFFLVLEPKENSPRLFDEIIRVLEHFRSRLSTAVGPKDGPRGLTVVITGSYPKQFYSHFPSQVIDRLCIVERHDYTGEITDLSKRPGTFQWVSLKHSRAPGEDAARVRALHAGTDPDTPGKFNVRIWDCHRDLAQGLTSGADSLNCDRDEIEPFQRLLAESQRRGSGITNTPAQARSYLRTSRSAQRAEPGPSNG